MHTPIQSDKAPAAIGTYSQAAKVGDLLFLSGQIPLDPDTMELVGEHDIEAQIRRVFTNISAVLDAAGADFSHLVKLNVYLTNLNHFPVVNSVMAELLNEPYPARAAIEVSALPKGAAVEIEGIAHLA